MRLRISVTADMVKAEAERRILAQWPISKQLNVLREGDLEAVANMSAAIDAMRAASNRLEAMQPIPANYTADSFWSAP